MFKALKIELHYTRRRFLESSISCGGYSITAQTQMLGRMTAGHRCTWQHTIRISTPSRCYSNTTQTSTRRMTKAKLRYTRPYPTMEIIPRERGSTSCSDYWSMGRTQMHMATTTRLRYIKPRSRGYSRSLECYSVTERT